MKFKALYRAMHDDLKDAGMMIDYACEIREQDEHDSQLADVFAKYAQTRLDHFDSFHQLLKQELDKLESDDTVYSCMWHETCKMMMDWYDEIKKKIEKY